MSENGPVSRTYRREDRIRKKCEFDRIFRRGRRRSGRLLTVLALPNPVGRPRLGVCVGKKRGKACRRNRFKRLLREAFRLRKTELPAQDLVVIPRNGADAPPDVLGEELVRLAKELVGAR